MDPVLRESPAAPGDSKARPASAPRVVFVDDDPMLLGGLRNLLRRQRHWAQAFTLGGEAALEELAARPADVVVTDMRMPLMDGASLLGLVRERHPHTVRVVLSGQAEHQAVLRTLAVAHQFLSKPCESEVLRRAVEQAFALRTVGEDVRGALGRLTQLPSPRALLDQVRQRAAARTATPEDVARLVGQDPALACRLLQLVSSSFFGDGQRVASIVEAVRTLGVALFAELAARDDVFASVDESSAAEAARVEGGRRAALAARIARRLVSDPARGELAATAALLGDVGRQALASSGLAVAEHAVDATGAALLDAWGLTPELGAIVTRLRHPTPTPLVPAEVVAAVHVAHALVAGDEARIDRAFLAEVLLLEALPAWRTIAADER